MNLPLVETGNNTQTASSEPSLSVAAQCHVVVHLRYDGLSVLISDSDRQEVRHLYNTRWLAGKDPALLVEECKRFLNQQQIDLSLASTVQWFFSVSKFCLIPDIFYEQGSGETLLDQTARLEPGDHIFSDFWNKRDIVSLYALPEYLLAYARQQNRSTEIAHTGFALNALFDQQTVQDSFYYLLVSPAFAELFMVQKGKVIFYNQLPHEGPEDLAYYILFAMEQAKVVPADITMHLAGDVQKGNGLFSLLGKYIGKVEEVSLPARLSADRNIPTNHLRQAAHLIASL